MRRRAASLFALTGLTALVAACSPGPTPECPCLPCEPQALLLTVIDAETSAAVDSFVLEVVFNGQPQGEPEACTADVRQGSNSCGFGNETGYYHLILTAPGYEQREMAVRYAGEGGGICCDACLQPQEVTAELVPRA